MNVELKEGFKQVCVLEGILMGKSTPKEFEDLIFEKFETRIQFLEEVETNPDIEDGLPVPDTGGRHDIFFAVHSEDVMKFSVIRLSFRIRWIEDVLAKGNYHSPIYPARIFDYCTWNEENIDRKVA